MLRGADGPSYHDLSPLSFSLSLSLSRLSPPPSPRPPLSFCLAAPPPGLISTGYTKRLRRATKRVQASARHQVVRVVLSR